MATLTGSRQSITRNLKEIFLWETVTCGDSGSAYTVPDWAGSLTVQAHGTFSDGQSPSTSATLTMQGSNDGSNWATLHAEGGNNLAFTSAGVEKIIELPRYVRPSLAAGNSPEVGGDVDVYLFARKK